MSKLIHVDSAKGRWQTLSLAEQMGNIGSEINRALKFQEKNKERFENAINRALDLFDLTIEDPRWSHRLKEITRVREVFCNTVFSDNEYNTSLDDLNQYFYLFALAARKNE
ncbi:MAG: hypothetical protein Q8J63_06775 [Candidatus Aquicultor sp.]|nr:hypothetical protein [Candidatus Aquicultor sp.]